MVGMTDRITLAMFERAVILSLSKERRARMHHWVVKQLLPRKRTKRG